MDPRAVLRPVGPRPSTVYWVRRLVFLAVAVLILVLLAHACSGGGSTGRPAAGSSPSPSVTPSATPTSSPTPHRAPVPECRAPQLKVTATTDAATYSAGAEPQLRAVVRNAGATCRYDPAPARRTWRIMSGTDRIWTTDDCSRSKQARLVRLGAGKSISYLLTWDRHRSVKGCAAPGATAQPGTYRLYVTVMGAASAPAVFHLAG